MDLIDLIESKRFLGNEFLMWLWFRSDCFDGLFESSEGSFELIFDDALTLEAYLAETERSDFRGGTPAYSAEARTALQQGKRTAKAKLRLVKDVREWVFTLKAAELDLSSIKIPTLLTEEDDEQFYERMFLLEELEDVVDGLYLQFLTLRLSDHWFDEMLPSMKLWIDGGRIGTRELYPESNRAA